MADITDPAIWMKGITACKTAVDTLRSVTSMYRDLRPTGGSVGKEEKAIDAALTIASSNAAMAEAHFAQALGFELCRCEFPPTPMTTVGYFRRSHEDHKPGDPVYECPKCGFTNAGPYGFERTRPKRG